MAPLVGAFTRLHPGLHAHLALSDAGLEVGEDAFDVVLRVGLPADGALMARKVATSPCVVCAAPAYLAARPPPRPRPASWRRTSAWCSPGARRVADEWSFHPRDGVDPHRQGRQGSLSSASGDVLHGWALAGFGISMEAMWDVAEDLASGTLVALLPDDHPVGIDLFATFAAGRLVPPRIRLFVDFLAERMPLLRPGR